MYTFNRRTFLKGIVSAAALTGSKTFADTFSISADTTTEELTSTGIFTSGAEGPACDRDGNLYAVNYSRQGTIGKVTPEGDHELFIDLPGASIGNGIRFGSDGSMFIADYTQHNILRVDMDTKDISVYAHNASMSQPNDIAIMKNDILLASDPTWSRGTGAVWRIDLDGNVDKLADFTSTSNGIEVSPDDSTLYVNTSGSREIWAFDLEEDGSISNKRLVIAFNDSGADGMRCDVEGNIYITRNGNQAVDIVSPAGEILGRVATIGRNPSNIAFGGGDGMTCYITLADRGSIESFRADYPGRSWQMYQDNPLSVTAESSFRPEQITVNAAWPNPFNSTTTIQYNLASDSDIVMRVYNMAGQTVENRPLGRMGTGKHSVQWRADSLPSGIYFVSLRSNMGSATAKVTYMK